MRNIVPADLNDVARSETLYRDAVRLGLIEDSEAAELRFFSLIEHARNYGDQPPKLLSALVRRKLWHVNQDEEEAARRRLRDHRRPEERPASPVVRGAVRIDLPETPPERAGNLLAGLLSKLRPMEHAHA